MDENWEYWKENALQYDKDNVKAKGKLYGKIESLMARFLHEDMDVLELASGSGNLALAFSSTVKSWTGIDYSDDVVKEARKLNLTNASFETGDAQDVRFSDSSFDVVVIVNALQVIPEPEKCLKEVQRVLKPGGLLLCSTFVVDELIDELGHQKGENSGIMTYHKWKSDEIMSYVENFGLKVFHHEIFLEDDESTVFLAAEKEFC